MSLLYGFLSAWAMAFSTFTLRATPDLGAALVAVALLFASLLILPRTFLLEDDQGTFDWLRLVSEPSAAYAGKAAYNLALMVLNGAAVGLFFLVFVDLPVVRPELLAAGIASFCLALGIGASFCGALVMGAANRYLLVAIVGLPLLIPVVALGVGSIRAGFGAGNAVAGWQSVAGLIGYFIAMAGGTPWLIGRLWSLDEPTQQADSVN